MAQVKPTSPGAVDLQVGKEPAKKPDFFRASSGRVFPATPYLTNQFLKGKFGLVGISKKEYDDAIKAEQS